MVLNVRCRRNLFVVLGLVAFAFAGRANADPPHFDPATVGAGPLLFFCHPAETPTGDRVEECFVYDPESKLPPQRIWRGEVPIPQAVCRPTADSLVISLREHLYKLELSTGQAKPLLPNDAKSEFVAFDGSSVFFLEKLGARSAGGYRLEHRNGVLNVVGYDRPRDRLFRLDAKSSKPVLLCDREIEYVICHDATHFYVVTAGDNRELLRIAKSGKVDALLACEADWVAPSIEHDFSSTGKYLALGIINATHDFNSERELCIFDLEKGKPAYAQARVKIDLGAVGNAISKLSTRWLDEKHLAYGAFSPKVIDAELGVDLDPEIASAVVAKHPYVLPPRKTTLGQFDLEFGLIYLKGETKPIASALDRDGVQVRDLAVDLKGDWAAFVSLDGDTFLVDGKKEKRLLLKHWSYELQWLPAVEGDPLR